MQVTGTLNGGQAQVFAGALGPNEVPADQDVLKELLRNRNSPVSRFTVDFQKAWDRKNRLSRTGEMGLANGLQDLILRECSNEASA